MKTCDSVPASIGVAIVDDDAEFRRLVHDTLAAHPDLRCVGECPDADSALANLPRVRPDVVLMDIEMPGVSGIECLRQLHEAWPGARVMMLTVFEDYDRIFESLKAGAMGYLIKRGVVSRLADAVRDLHAGESPISPSIARKLIQTFRAPLEDLSTREREILEHLARGQQYKEIAVDLGVSFHTVRTHVGAIYEKLHVHSRQEAIGKLDPRRGAR